MPLAMATHDTRAYASMATLVDQASSPVRPPDTSYSSNEDEFNNAVTTPLLSFSPSYRGASHDHVPHLPPSSVLPPLSPSFHGADGHMWPRLSPVVNVAGYVPPRPPSDHPSSPAPSPHPHASHEAAGVDRCSGAEEDNVTYRDLYSVHSPRTLEACRMHRDSHNLSFASEDGAARRGPSTLGNEASTTTNIAADAHSNACTPRLWPQRITSVFTPSFVAFRDRVRHMTWKRILWVILLVALVMVGNFMQIVMLNFWLISFPSDGTPGNYTAFAVPGIFFAILFALLLGVYVVVRRPSLRFATHLHGWGVLLGVGFNDAFNSWMATYAASYTSEVLQALFTNLCPLYAVFLSKWILRDTRRYANVYITSVFVLTICGILAASLYGLIKDHHASDGKWWILIFFLSMPLRVLMNVWQSLYMIVYTHDPKFVSWLRVRFAEEAETVSAAVGATPDTPDNDGDGMSHRTTTTAAAAAAAAAAAPQKNLSVQDEEDDEGHDPDGDDTPRGSSDLSSVHPGRPTTDHSPHKRSPLMVATAQMLKDDNDEEADGIGTSPLCSDEPITTSEREAGDNRHTAEDACGPCGRTPEDVPRGTGAANAEDEDDELTRSAAAAPPLPEQTMFTVRYNQGEDTIVKLVMLAGETAIQMCFTLSLLPADALPWWGNSNTVMETWGNFAEGIRYVFTIRENFIYCFLYTLGFVFTYVGSAYLNHYSAALCSIVTQLSSPVTALMLVLVPSWNVQVDGDSPWYCNVVAIVFLCIAAFVYVLWEELTDDEKVQAEYELKMQELHVRPSSHERPHSVVIHG